LTLLRRPRRAPPPLADEVVIAPPPLDEQPPADRYCDLVLTGGVASGVVYPWAMLELARSYHFKNIGGTSVGAMAAALAAAAEYGRRNGYRNAFEPLRRTPEQLAEWLPDGRTRLLSLFQTRPEGHRLLELFATAVRKPDEETAPGTTHVGSWLRQLRSSYCAELRRGALFGAALVGVAVAALVCTFGLHRGWPAHPLQGLMGLVVAGGLLALGALLGALLLLGRTLLREFRVGLIDNGFGLCKGACTDPAGDIERPGLTDWLHEGVQRSAGLRVDDAPLTFRDLWHAPLAPGSVQRGDKANRAIDLQMITTNVTHMRPYKLPLADASSRLYFRRCELEGLFPKAVLDALEQAARRELKDSKLPRSEHADLLPLPTADMPIVVAARLSLSFPLLFSAVPLLAVDYEQKSEERLTARCWFTDGGLCSNFPIHFFDALLPRWPTFGIWLRRRSPYHPDESVWLPKKWDDGRGDLWHRFDPQSVRQGPLPELPWAGRLLRRLLLGREAASGPSWRRLGGFLLGGGLAAKDWSDMLAMRLPHNRHRIAQVCLREGEGELNIAMGRRLILRMAHEYGTQTASKLLQHYAASATGQPTPYWKQQRWVRLLVLTKAARKALKYFQSSADGAFGAPTVEQLLEEARCSDLRQGVRQADLLSDDESRRLRQVVLALRQLEEALQGTEDGPKYEISPDADLRLTPPM
jgi:predicted acylesterase/phospholipase RssA